MAPGRQKRNRADSDQLLQQADPTPSLASYQTQSLDSNQTSSLPSNPSIVAPISSTASTTTNKGSGETKGKGLEKINRAHGKNLAIQISKDKGRPINYVQSSKLSNELGIIARNLIPVPTKWKDMSEEDKEVAFNRLNARFEINLDEQHVRDSCEKLLMARSSDQRSKLKRRFKKHNSIEEARRDLPKNMSQENWNVLCDMFADPKYQHRCNINKGNRAKQTVKHNQGSRAFVPARHFLREEENVELDRIEFYKKTHCKDETWLSIEAKTNYDEMIRLKTQPTPEGGTPLSPDEIVDRVLGTKSGYIRGLGHGPKPTTTRSSHSTTELEAALRANRELREQLKANDERMERLEARQANYDKLFEALTAAGVIPSPST